MNPNPKIERYKHRFRNASLPVIDVNKYLKACDNHRVLSWIQSALYSLWREACISPTARAAQALDFLSHN